MPLPEVLRDLPDAIALEAFDAAAITGGKFHNHEWTLNIDAAKIVRVCEFLRVDRG